MNKTRCWLGYLLLLLGVWLVSYFLYPETLGAIERDRFFVWTPDYRTSLLRQGICGVWRGGIDFVAQFFRWQEVGALLLTLGAAVIMWGSDCLLRLLFPKARWRAYLVGGCCCVGLVAWMFSPRAHQRELRIRIEQAATRQAWNQILQLAVDPAVQQDPLLQKYLFLALAERQQLVANLHRWPHLTAESFCYVRPKTGEERYFNAIFYRSLGIYNEYVHQLFEVGMQLPHGTSFDTLRQLADAYLKMGHAALASKYLTILDQSTCHADWVASRRALLQTLSEHPIETPDRSPRDLYIGSYPLLQELDLLLQDNPTNQLAKIYQESLQAIQK